MTYNERVLYSAVNVASIFESMIHSFWDIDHKHRDGVLIPMSHGEQMIDE
jgi:hypothetical protein